MSEAESGGGAVTKSAAQRRADRIAAFRAELAELERAGVVALGAEERAAVARHHEALLGELAERFDVDVAPGEKQLSLGMRIASFLGAVALAASAFLFFRRYWGLLSTPAQVALLIAAPALSLAAADLAARRERTGYFASLLGLLAFSCLVLDITMLGQIFNVTPSPTAFLVWGAFGLLLGYAYGLRLLLATGAVAAGIWLAAEIVGCTGAPWTSFFERPESFLPAGLLAFAAGALLRRGRQAESAPLYRGLGLAAVLLVFLGLAGWGNASFLPLAEKTVETIYEVLGFAACAAAIWLGIRRQWRETVTLGTAFFVAFLYSKYVDWFWDWMPKYLFFLIVGLTAVAALVLLKRLRSLALGRLRETSP
jgi:uncharacterized membrane protein